jgi:uncharacterized protein YbbC (DUF1343 family)
MKALDIKIGALFGPEHGVRGEVAAGQQVPNGIDARTGIPIYSLYGATRKPTPEMLKGLDAVIFDVQDVGSRFYTFISTMYFAMQACAQNNIPFIVLDRPNPISGQAVEGNILDKQFASFVGLHPIPIRHGMTMGELAMMFNGEFAVLCDLKIVGCIGWKRSLYYDETELPWVLPSPNIPTPDTALVYPGTCFFEGTNVSEGRGTTKPFELIGAPWIDAYALADALNAIELSGVRFRPAHFIPSASKYSQQMCNGVQIHVLDRKAFEPVKTGFHIVKMLCRMYPDSMQFLPAGNTGKLFFDLLAGTDRIRTSLQSEMPVDELINSWYYDLKSFLEIRKKYLIYL